MHVQGGLVFECLENVPNAKQIKQLLLRKHNAKSRVIIKENKAAEQHVSNPTDKNIDWYTQNDNLKPLTNFNTTHMIHPSPLSFAALDYVFENAIVSKSPHGTSLFTHIRKLNELLSAYVFLDMILTIYKELPTCLPHPDVRMINKLEGEDILDYKKRVYGPIINEILNCLESIQYSERIAVLSEKFDFSMRIYLCLGVVPVLKTNYRPDIRNASSNNNTLQQMMDMYMRMLEQSMSVLSVPSLNEIKTNLLLTVHQDQLSCTDYNGEAFTLFSYDRQNVSFFHTYRPCLLDLFQYEFEYSYFTTKSKKQAIENQSKLSIVVSTGFSKTGTEIMKSISNKYVLDMDPAKTLQEISKDEKSVGELRAKAQLLNTQYSKYSGDGEDKFASYKEDMQALEHKIKLHSKTNFDSSVTDLALTDNTHNIHNFENHLFSDATDGGLIHAAPSDQKKMSINKMFIVEEKKLKLQNRELSLHLRKCLRESTLLKKEVFDLTSCNAKLEYLLKLKKIDENLRKKQHAEFEKQNETNSELIAKQNLVIKRMEQIVSDLLERSQMDARDKYRLMRVFSGSYDQQNSAENAPQISFSKLDLQQGIDEFVNFFLSGKFLIKKNNKSNNKSFTAYDLTLEELGIRVIPFFSMVNDIEMLNHCNKCLPYKYMYDRRTYDPSNTKPIQISSLESQSSSPTCVYQDSCLVLYDINHQPEEQKQKLYKQITSLGGMPHLETELFEKRYLNCQFQSGYASLEKYLSEKLKEKWSAAIANIFLLSCVRYTINGQKLGAEVTLQSICKFLTPFLETFRGKTQFTRQIYNFMTEIFSSNLKSHTESTDLLIESLNFFYTNVFHIK